MLWWSSSESPLLSTPLFIYSFNEHGIFGPASHIGRHYYRADIMLYVHKYASCNSIPFPLPFNFEYYDYILHLFNAISSVGMMKGLGLIH